MTTWALYITSYVVASRGVLALPRRWLREVLFAVLNLGVVYFAFVRGSQGGQAWLFAAHAALVVVCYGLLRGLGQRGGVLFLVALLSPIAWLVLSKALSPVACLGVSYLAFRLSLVVYELSNGEIEMPSFAGYLGYAFFAPLFLLGPISPYSQYSRALDRGVSVRCFTPEAFARILIGAAKFLMLSAWFERITGGTLWRSGWSVTPMEWFVAAAASHFYLYYNFSGFCDVVCGTSALCGVEVKENFKNPFAARNLTEYWQRWHVSLADYLKAMVFVPLSMAVSRRLPRRQVKHGLALSIALTFFLVGVWHGVTWPYLVVGALHGAGMLVHYYYSVWVRGWPKPRRQRYERSAAVRLLATALTFSYVSATCLVFVLAEHLAP